LARSTRLVILINIYILTRLVILIKNIYTYMVGNASFCLLHTSSKTLLSACYILSVGNASFYMLHTFRRIETLPFACYILSDMGSQTLPSACYILSDGSSILLFSTSNRYNSIPFYSTSNGYIPFYSTSNGYNNTFTLRVTGINTKYFTLRVTGI